MNRPAPSPRWRQTRPRLPFRVPVEGLEDRTVPAALDPSLDPVLVNWHGSPHLAVPGRWLAQFDGVSGTATEQVAALRPALAPPGLSVQDQLGLDGLIDAGDVLRPRVDGRDRRERAGTANGFTDDITGWDFVNNNSDDRHTRVWHGTHVAGAAARVWGQHPGVTYTPVRNAIPATSPGR